MRIEKLTCEKQKRFNSTILIKSLKGSACFYSLTGRLCSFSADFYRFYAVRSTNKCDVCTSVSKQTHGNNTRNAVNFIF